MQNGSDRPKRSAFASPVQWVIWSFRLWSVGASERGQASFAGYIHESYRKASNYFAAPIARKKESIISCLRRGVEVSLNYSSAACHTYVRSVGLHPPQCRGMRVDSLEPFSSPFLRLSPNKSYK